MGQPGALAKALQDEVVVVVGVLVVGVGGMVVRQSHAEEMREAPHVAKGEGAAIDLAGRRVSGGALGMGRGKGRRRAGVWLRGCEILAAESRGGLSFVGDNCAVAVVVVAGGGGGGGSEGEDQEQRGEEGGEEVHVRWSGKESG